MRLPTLGKHVPLMTRRYFPTQIAKDLVNVQPMSGPVTSAFATRFKFGKIQHLKNKRMNRKFKKKLMKKRFYWKSKNVFLKVIDIRNDRLVCVINDCEKWRSDLILSKNVDNYNPFITVGLECESHQGSEYVITTVSQKYVYIGIVNYATTKGGSITYTWKKLNLSW